MTDTMSQVFISYSRVDAAFVDLFIRRLQRAFPDLKIWYDQAPHGLIGGGSWWNDILNAVAASDVFIYILSNESVNSLYCQAEFTEARRLQKRIITVQARDRTKLTDDLDDIQFINMKDGVDSPEAFASLVAAVNLRLKEAEKFRNARPLWKPATPKPRKEAPPVRSADAPDVETSPLARPSAEEEAVRLTRSGVRWQIIGVVVSVILGIAALALTAAQLLREANPSSVAQGNTPSAVTQSPAASSGSGMPTLSNLEQLQTAQMQLTQSAATQAAADLTTIQDTVLSANATGTAQQIAATEAAAQATLLALSATPTPSRTPTATATSTPDPLQAAFTPVARNADWTPIERDFDGVMMVLVPAGCFDMGATTYSDDQPVHQQCFDEPFWIDKYEVTQAQFRRLGGTQANPPHFSGDELPVENITWFEARDFCALRDSRLPTEAEWEYTARGPDNLVYPWGNTWNASNAVWNRSGSLGTANVGSIPAGVSWVGALDMSGNVWEWTSSLFESYPYDETDGREADTGSRTDVLRVLRGGSWLYYDADYLRAAVRDRDTPVSWYFDGGFRCARSS